MSDEGCMWRCSECAEAVDHDPTRPTLDPRYAKGRCQAHGIVILVWSDKTSLVTAIAKRSETEKARRKRIRAEKVRANPGDFSEKVRKRYGV